MEPSEIIADNEEVIETAAEEIATAGSGSILKYAATFGIGALVGIIVYERALKPLCRRLREWREDRKDNVITVEARPVEEGNEDDKETSDEET